VSIVVAAWILIPLITLLMLFGLTWAALEVLKVPILVFLGIILFDMIGHWFGGMLRLKWWVSYLAAIPLVILICWHLYQSWTSIAIIGGALAVIYFTLRGLFRPFIEGLVRGLKMPKELRPRLRE